MLRMAQIKYIKDLYENEEASLREISRITGHSFETVRKYAYQENWSEDNLPDIEPRSYPVLQDFIPIIDRWLEEDRKAPRKQRHTVILCTILTGHCHKQEEAVMVHRPVKGGHRTRKVWRHFHRLDYRISSL